VLAGGSPPSVDTIRRAVDTTALRRVTPHRRALFVLLSNDPEYLDELRSQLDGSHQGLAKRVELPLPPPSVKEEIVRTNTNLLNPRSYWFCLDQGVPSCPTTSITVGPTPTIGELLLRLGYDLADCGSDSGLEDEAEHGSDLHRFCYNRKALPFANSSIILGRE